MPTATIDGIDTYFETYGAGMPILMCAPGGFDSTIEKWRTASAWTGIGGSCDRTRYSCPRHSDFWPFGNHPTLDP